MSEWTSRDVEEALPALRRYARALTKDFCAADDLVQEALLRAYERAASFRPDGSLRTWLLAIVHNRFIDSQRRQAMERGHKDALARTDVLAPLASDPEQSLYLRQVAARFEDLPVEQRSVLHLVAVEGMTYREVAEALGLPIGTVMSRLNRARERLRRAEQAAAPLTQLRIIGGRDGD